jgi:hypothetical protein
MADENEQFEAPFTSNDIVSEVKPISQDKQEVPIKETPVEGESFFSKAINTVKDEYIKYVKESGERLISEKDDFVPGNLFGSSLIPYPIRKAIFSAVNRTADDETKKAFDRYKQSAVGQLDLGVQKGGTDLASALLKLGGIGLDLTTEQIDEQFGTDIGTKTLDVLEEVIPNIKADSTTGEITALVSQFAIPQVAVFKIGDALFKAKKLGLLPTISQKVAELTKRAVTYAPLEFGAAFIATDPSRLKSASEIFGFIDPYDQTLSGADQAREDLSKRFFSAAEAASVAGVVPAFPLLASKALGVLGKTGAYTFQGVQKAVGIAVDNPIAKFVGSSKYSPLAIGARAVQKLDMGKIGLPSFNEWRQYSTRSDRPLQKVLAYADRFLSNFRQEGVLAPIFKRIKVNADGAVNSEIRFLNKKIEEIGDEITKIGYRFQKSFFDDGTSLSIIEKNKNDVFKFIAREGRLTDLDKNLRAPAIEIRKKLTDLVKRMAGVVEEKDVAAALFKEADGYLIQGYTSFNNQAFKPKAENVAKAVEYFKRLIAKDSELSNLVLQRTGAKKATLKDPLFAKGLDEEAVKMVDDVINTAKGNYSGKEYTATEILNTIAKDYLKIEKPNLLAINKELPSVVKDLLGRSSSYENAVIDTAMQAAKAIYGKRLGDDLFSEGIKGGWLYTTKDAPRILKNIKGGEFMQIRPSPNSLFAQGKVFTEGVYAAKPIAKALMEMDQKLISLFEIPIYKQMMAYKSGAQFAKTVLSPVTQVRNVTSGPMFILNAGLYGSKANILDSIKIITQDLFPKGPNSKAFLDYIEDAVYRGILDENIITNELKFILKESNKKGLTPDGFIKLITESRFGRKATDVYQAGDNLWKIFADKTYQDMLKGVVKYKPLYDKNGNLISSKIDMRTVTDWWRNIAQEPFNPNSIKTGVAKTAEEIIGEMSAFYVTNVIPTYSRTPAAITWIRQLPVGNFVAFPAEVMRTSMRNLQFASRELASDNAVLRQNGLKRVLGTLATNYGLAKTLSVVGTAMTGVTQEMMDAYRRTGAPTYQKNGDLFPVSGIEKPGTGNFKVIDNSYYNPYSVNRRGATAILNAFAEGKLTKENAGTIVMNAFFGNPLTGTPGSLQEWFGSFYEESLAPEKLADIFLRGGETRTGRKIFYPTDNSFEKIDKALLHVFSAAEPGGLTTLKRVYKGVTGEFTKYGTQLDPATEGFKVITGLNVQPTKPIDSIPFYINSFNKDMQNIDSKYRGQVLDATKSALDKVNSFKQHALDSYRAQNIFKIGKDDFITMKVNPVFIEEQLEARYNTDQASRIMSDLYKSPNPPSEKTTERYRKDVLGKLPIGESIREEMKFDAALSTMEQIQDTISDFPLGQSVDKLEKQINNIIKLNEPFLRGTSTTPGFRRPELVKPETSQPQSSIPNLGTSITQSVPVSPQVVSLNNPLAGMIQGTGLTATENAYLSNEEKAIKMRQRGIG